MTSDYFVFDDPLMSPSEDHDARALAKELFDATLGPATRSGSYQNKFGETITWESGDGWVTLHTPFREHDDIRRITRW